MELTEFSQTCLTSKRPSRDVWRDVGRAETMRSMRPSTRSLAEHVFAIDALVSETARQALLANLGDLCLEFAIHAAEHVRNLLQVGDVRCARAVAGSEGVAMEGWTDLLQPPTVMRRPASAAGGFQSNQEWLRSHANEYAGCWVALRAGQLIGHDMSRGALHRALNERGSLADVLFVRLD